MKLSCSRANILKDNIIKWVVLMLWSPIMIPKTLEAKNYFDVIVRCPPSAAVDYSGLEPKR